jgi:hypothetical protein
VALTGPPRMEARRLVAPRCLRFRAHGQGQSVHPPRLRAVAGTAAIIWRRWSERSVTFSVPTASWSSAASCAEVTGRGWRAAITSSTACWRAVRWLANSRGREVLDRPPEQRRRRASPVTLGLQRCTAHWSFGEARPPRRSARIAAHPRVASAVQREWKHDVSRTVLGSPCGCRREFRARPATGYRFDQVAGSPGPGASHGARPRWSGRYEPRCRSEAVERMSRDELPTMSR